MQKPSSGKISSYALIIVCFSASLSSAFAAQTSKKFPDSRPTSSQNQSISKQSTKPLLLIEKSLQVSAQPLVQKLAFVEQLQREIDTTNISTESRSRLLTAQAIVLMSEDQTLLPSIELLRQANAFSPLLLKKEIKKRLWDEFYQKLNSSSVMNYNALADVAWTLQDAEPPESDQQQLFFIALAAQNRGELKKSLNLFNKIQPSSHYYREAKLHEGLLLAAHGQQQQAKIALDVVLSLDLTEAEKKQDIGSDYLIQMKEIATLNLARLLFEGKEFNESLALYRSIDAQSPLFYESLSEQGWAFFMAGHPNRALGVKYGATSPFFSKLFQPDQYFLSAAIHYWLCDFKSSKENIRDFVTHTNEDAVLLRKWKFSNVDTTEKKEQRINEAFQIVENIFHGVSSKNNTLGPRVLQTLTQKPSLRKRMAELEQVRQKRLAAQKNQWPIRIKKALLDAFVERERREQSLIGQYALLMVESMLRDYERSLGQMRIIHLEIMTAEKDRLMKTERSSEGQEFMGTDEQFIESVQQTPQLWNNEKREFWKDELDSFVFHKTSQCKNYEQGENQSDEK